MPAARDDEEIGLWDVEQENVDERKKKRVQGAFSLPGLIYIIG